MLLRRCFDFRHALDYRQTQWTSSRLRLRELAMICRAAVLVSRQQPVPHRDVDDLEDGRNYSGIVAALAVRVRDSASLLHGSCLSAT